MGANRTFLASNVRSCRRVLAAILSTLLLLLAAFATLIHSDNVAAERALDERFLTRASLTSEFTRNYIDDIAARERRQAERLLGGSEVDRAVFEQVVGSLDFDAAVLLDDQGRLLQVWPRQPDLLGADMATAYPHLRTALLGRVAVSEIVPSAARGVHVTAVAVPFESVTGRRVLSGASSPTTTPLAEYFSSAIAITGGAAYLIDRSGNTVTAGQEGRALPPGLAGAPAGITRVDTDAGRLTVAIAEVENSPWRVVLTVPNDSLYLPVAGGRWAAWALLAALAGAGVFLLVLFGRLGRARLEAARTAHTDALTGLPNRRALDEVLARAAAHATRHDDPLAVLMIDLDHFKAINDTHGHDVGDLVLREVASALRDAGRDEDLAGRWGGEEFLVVLQSTAAAGVAVAAERLRSAIAAVEVASGRHLVRLTASIGGAVMAPGGDLRALLRASDGALYRAKAGGRNAIEMADPVAWAPMALDPSLV